MSPQEEGFGETRRKHLCQSGKCSQKNRACGDYQLNDVLRVDVEVGGQPAGLRSPTKPQGKDEKGAMAGTSVEPSKTTHDEITLKEFSLERGSQNEWGSLDYWLCGN